MKKGMTAAVMGMSLVALLTGCQSSGKEERTEVMISAAASLTDVMDELAGKYEALHPDVELNFTFGGSGALQTQIEEGAPVDLFFSAAEDNMDALEQQGMIISDTRKDLLKNEIVLIVPADSEKNFTFAALPDEAEKIALGEPESVPAGKYAQQVFESLGNWEAVKRQAVFAGNVREVLTWVENKEADLGVVYATDAAAGENIRIVDTAPEGAPEVIYPAAVVRDCRNPEEAAEFLEYMAREEAEKIFEAWGFTVL